MRQWISLVTTPLMEASVVNVSEVDSFCAHFAAKVESSEAKAWFAKKLRREILNDESGLYLHRANPSRFPEPQPDWLKAAVERGEEVFEFTPQRNPDEINHLVDFFQSLEKTASYQGEVQVQIEDASIGRKLLSKLSKMNFEQATQASNEWFTRMGHRALTGTKAGVEIVHTWENGFYAVRYTDQATMQRDGAELQNCLATGTYWSSVEQGSMAVYGIRNPSHEAVVGIRVENHRGTPMLRECKGKSNKSPNEEYLPYCTSFLTALGTRNNISDLKSVGIMCGAGGYGTFEEVAVPEKIGKFTALIVDDMVEISYRDKKLTVRRGGNDYHASGSFNLILSELREIPKRDVIDLLNALTERGFDNIGIMTTAEQQARHSGKHKMLKSLGIFYRKTAKDYYDNTCIYGTFEEVAKKTKTPFGDVYLAVGYAMCPIGSKKLMIDLDPLDSYYSSRMEKISPSMMKATFPQGILGIVKTRELAEVLNRLRHLKIKNEIVPETAGLSFDKVGSKKVYTPFVEKLAPVVRDTEKGHLVYRFPKEGTAEKVVIATKSGWRQVPIENGRMSMASLSGNKMRDGHTMLLGMKALETTLRKLKLTPRDEDGYLGSSGKVWDEKSKRLIDIDTLPLVGDAELMEVHKAPSGTQWFFQNNHRRNEGRFGTLSLRMEYKGLCYQFTGTGWDGDPYIFQHINAADPLPKAAFYNYSHAEQSGMMETEDGFASTPEAIATEIEKIASFMADSWKSDHTSRALALAHSAFKRIELTEAQQMLLVNAMTKNIIATSNHAGSKGYAISPYAIAFANNPSGYPNSPKIKGKALEILRQRIDMAIEKAQEMGLGNSALPEKIQPNWHNQRKAA